MKTICFDLDGTLCEQTDGDYSSAQPIPEAIAAVNGLHDAGYRIVIHTARFMGRAGDDPVLAHEIGFEFTRRQLAGWNVRYDELTLGKPRYDVVVDDRSLFFNRDWSGALNRELQ